MKGYEPDNPLSAEAFDYLYFNYDPYHSGVESGQWYYGFLPTSRGADWAWGWGALGWALVDMYKVTNNLKYLELMIPQIDWIISHRDIDLNRESYTGTKLSLPVWSDDGYYGGPANFVYTYRVHTALICYPILRFVDTVLEQNLKQYFGRLNQYVSICNQALAVHNRSEDWVCFSENRGYYKNPSFGTGVILEAGKIDLPNRVHPYLMACGLVDKILGIASYRGRIEDALRQFREWIRYDPCSNSYYWSYWPLEYGESGWEDISHAQLTMFGLFYLHFYLGYNIYTFEDFIRIANTALKIIDIIPNPPLVRVTLMGEYRSIQHQSITNYAQAAGWANLGVIKPIVLIKTRKVNQVIYQKLINHEIRFLPVYLRNLVLNI